MPGYSNAADERDNKIVTSESILIVDGQEEFITFGQTWLEQKGFKLQFARTGTDALTLLQTNHFDLVLLELSLSDMSGLDILRHISNVGLDVPVIISSTSQSVSVNQVNKVLQMGAAAFLQKPCSSEILLDNIYAVLERSSIGTIQGNLLDLSLTSLITLGCNEGKTARLNIRHDGHKATIYFEKGQIIHAILDEQVGEEAIYEILAWNEGDFIMSSGYAPSERTIQTSWSRLMLEGLKRLDETAFDQEQFEVGSLANTPLDGHQSHLEKRSSIFDLDYDTHSQIEDRIDQLDTQLVARCILFTTRSGRLLHFSSQMSQSQVLILAALVAGSFSATNEVPRLLAATEKENKSQSQQQSLQEGPNYGMYSAAVGSKWILTIVFNPDEANLGMVRHFALQTAMDLSKLLSKAENAVGQRQEIAKVMDEVFQREVDDMLGDIFDF